MVQAKGLAVKIGHLLEAAGASLVIAIISVLPVDWASAFGGWLGRTIGPRFGISKRATRNLTRALPEMPAAEVETTIRAMWDNLGRTAAEYPHVGKFWDARVPEDREGLLAMIAGMREAGEAMFFAGERVEVAGLEHLERLLAHRGAALFFSAHLGNWEVLPCWAARVGIPISVVYRAPNNPYFAKILRRLRSDHGPLLPKGLQGALASVKVLEEGGRLGMLMDQKQNRGLAVPFFGRPAMTAPTIAKLALRYDCPIFGAWVQRLDGARFRITFAPPIEPRSGADEDAEIMAILVRINALLEDWIRARPDQWLWMHRRWRE